MALDFSQAQPIKQEEKVIPQNNDNSTNINIKQETIEKPIESEGLDFSKGREVKSDLDTLDFTNADEVKISNFEKLEYGWDKSTNVVGNVFRIAKAKAQDWMDEDKSFKDYILENEAKRQAEIKKEHWKFTNNKEAQDSGLVLIGELASIATDPYYLGGYYLGAPALTNPFTSAALNAALAGGDTAIDSLAKTGEIDYGSVGTSAVVGGTIGAVIPVGGKIIKKLLPKAKKEQIEQITNWLDNKIAKKNNLTVPELKKIQQVTNSTGVKQANDALTKWNANFFQPITKEITKQKAKETRLFGDIKYLKDLKALAKKQLELRKINKNQYKVLTKGNRKQILETINSIRNTRKQSELTRKALIKKQQTKLEKWSELVAKRDTKILEELRKTEGRVDWAVRSLLSASVKPLIGAGAGASFGTLFGDDNDDILRWAAAGAAAGQFQKMIQRSARFGTQEKGKLLGLIDREMVALTMQKVRSALSATTATKLASYGGPTEKIGKLLLREVDSSVSEKSVIAAADAMERNFQRKAFNLVKGFTDEEQAQALSIVRGKEITDATPNRIKQLSENIKSYLNEFNQLSKSAGFFPKKEIDNYFPRVLNYEKIKQDEKKFLSVVTDIFESLGVKGTYTSGNNIGRSKAAVAAEQYAKGHKINGDSVFNLHIVDDLFKGTRKSKQDDVFVTTPVSDHITKERMLNGPYKKVEEVLEKNGYLINDVGYVLNNLVNNSVKSIAFARQFGTNGELLKPFFIQLRNKYLNSGLKPDVAERAAEREAKLVIDTVDAYFDRYGKQQRGASESIANTLSTLSNLQMLDRVTLTSLGDLVQPFQNSSQFRSVIKGWKDTALKAKNEKGLAQSMNYDISNEIRKSLLRSAGMKGDINSATAWMGERPSSKINNFFFKGIGLEWLTGYARRFAYNTGAADAYYLSKQLAKVAKKDSKLESGSAKKIIKFLNYYNINPKAALNLAETKSFNDAIKIKSNKTLLDRAGIVTANRDAIIPQMDNRLLFTQNRNPLIRMFGQFLSWAQAKSAQTNKILKRIEDGNAKTLIKTLAVIPIYSGIQSLREVVKHGQVVTDLDEDTERWWAEGGRLSGMFGWLPDLVANRTIGPGSREPWFTFAPFFQFLTSGGEAIIDTTVGTLQGNPEKFDKATRTFWEKIAPLPTVRRLINRLFQSQPKDIGIGGKSFSGGKLMFNIGGVAAKALATAVKRGDTAISTTIGTYKKVNKIFDDNKVKSVHDFGSGLGLGSKEFVNKNVTSHEPFVPLEKIIKSKGKVPDYKQFDDVLLKEGFASKDGVVNLNVLNVIEDPIERANVVKNIAQLINNDGMAIITTRGSEVAAQASKSKNAVPFGDGFLFGKGDKKTFQKGFSQKELEKFIKETLGDLFSVEKIPNKYKIGTSGVIIKKNRPQFSEGDEVIVPKPKPYDITAFVKRIRSYVKAGTITKEYGQTLIDEKLEEKGKTYKDVDTSQFVKGGEDIGEKVNNTKGD